jgi:hypothetical protein
MTRQKVGFRRRSASVSPNVGSSVLLALDARCATRGSRTTSSINRATGRPRRPTTMKLFRQPRKSANRPPNPKPTTPPSGAAMVKKASAEARRALGTMSAIRDVAAGMHPASPMPTPVRATSMCQNEVAKPQTAVKPLQTVTHPAITRERFVRSESREIGTPNVE